jgi:hypothetical protein
MMKELTGKKKGGAITKDKKFGIGGMAGKAVKSAVATRELEKQAVLRAEAAAKSAAKQALMPQYNEAVKGMTQKQKPLSFEEWKAINYPEGTQGLQNAPQKQTFKYPQESLPAEERDANLAKFLEPSQVKERMYHGTGYNFNEFRKKPYRHDESLMRATFVTPEPNIAERFAKSKAALEGNEGANIMPVHVQVTNPFDYNNKNHVERLMEYLDNLEEKPDYYQKSRPYIRDAIYLGDFGYIEEPFIKKAIENLGHDSFYVNEFKTKNLGIFDPNRIKSATGNLGTYDINEADINKASGGSVNLDAMYMAVNDAKFRRK